MASDIPADFNQIQRQLNEWDALEQEAKTAAETLPPEGATKYKQLLDTATEAVTDTVRLDQLDDLRKRYQDKGLPVPEKLAQAIQGKLDRTTQTYINREMNFANSALDEATDLYTKLKIIKDTVEKFKKLKQAYKDRNLQPHPLIDQEITNLRNQAQALLAEELNGLRAQVEDTPLSYGLEKNLNDLKEKYISQELQPPRQIDELIKRVQEAQKARNAQLSALNSRLVNAQAKVNQAIQDGTIAEQAETLTQELQTIKTESKALTTDYLCEAIDKEIADISETSRYKTTPTQELLDVLHQAEGDLTGVKHKAQSSPLDPNYQRQAERLNAKIKALKQELESPRVHAEVEQGIRDAIRNAQAQLAEATGQPATTSLEDLLETAVDQYNTADAAKRKQLWDAQLAVDKALFLEEANKKILALQQDINNNPSNHVEQANQARELNLINASKIGFDNPLYGLSALLGYQLRALIEICNHQQAPN